MDLDRFFFTSAGGISSTKSFAREKKLTSPTQFLRLNSVGEVSGVDNQLPQKPQTSSPSKLRHQTKGYKRPFSVGASSSFLTSSPITRGQSYSQFICKKYQLSKSLSLPEVSDVQHSVLHPGPVKDENFLSSSFDSSLRARFPDRVPPIIPNIIENLVFALEGESLSSSILRNETFHENNCDLNSTSESSSSVSHESKDCSNPSVNIDEESVEFKSPEHSQGSWDLSSGSANSSARQHSEPEDDSVVFNDVRKGEAKSSTPPSIFISTPDRRQSSGESGFSQDSEFHSHSPSGDSSFSECLSAVDSPLFLDGKPKVGGLAAQLFFFDSESDSDDSDEEDWSDGDSNIPACKRERTLSGDSVCFEEDSDSDNDNMQSSSLPNQHIHFQRFTSVSICSHPKATPGVTVCTSFKASILQKNDDSDVEEEDYGQRLCLDTINAQWDKHYSSSCPGPLSTMNVKFAADQDLATVHHIDQEDRHGTWVIDRERFCHRIQSLGEVMAPFLEAGHREKVHNNLTSSL